MSDVPESRVEAKARVIVVDDNRLIRELAKDALDELVSVETCASGEAALEALAREPAMLVVSDLEMPGMSGIDLLERIRLEHPGTEFIILTANASIDSAVRALRMGAADYLRKPVRADELGAVVEQVIARRRLIEENERLREMLDVVESCRTLTRCLDPGEVYAVALDVFLPSLSRSRGLAFFRRTAIPTSDGVAFRGFGEADAVMLRNELVNQKSFDMESVDGIEVVHEGPVVDLLRKSGIHGGRVLSVPLRGNGEELGIVWIIEDEGARAFEAGEIERALIIAGHAHIALANAERYSHAKARAFIDDVTEVYNARYLLQAIDHEIQRAKRYDKQLSVLFLDLDRFKLVNDQHGHLIGSQVLRRLSEVLQPCIRQVDTLARYGGDEFTIVLIDTSHEAGLAVAERIRRTVAEAIFDGGGDQTIRLSISIGGATYPAHGMDREHLLDASDKAMYRAKSLGRDQVCSADDLG